MKQNILKSIIVILISAASWGLAYLYFNGAYHTNSNLNWRAQQAGLAGYNEGYQDAASQLFSSDKLCGGAGVSFISASGTLSYQCYK